MRDALTVEAARGIDVVVDYLWGRPTELVLEALAKGLQGRVYAQNPPRGGRRQRRPDDYLPAPPCAASTSPSWAADSAPRRSNAFLPPFPALFDLAAKGKLTIDVEPVPLAQVESGLEPRGKGPPDRFYRVADRWQGPNPWIQPQASRFQPLTAENYGERDREHFQHFRCLRE